MEVVAAATPVAVEAGTGATARFRADIEGLRAVAVLLVVLHHVGVPGFAAGFIGVDVFFVISGYLITGKLLAEVASTGGVSLGAFWAGRMRRLLPIAATVIATTLLASFLITNPLGWAQLVDQARAGALFVANAHFGGLDTGYFTAGTRESPFLHLWSLAVEEQFYLVMPLALAASLRSRGRQTSLERPTLVIAGLTGASLLIAAVLTSAGTPHAYYSLASRGWELGVGCLLAIAWPLVHRRREPFRTLLWCVGALVLALGLAVVDRSGFPAWGALYPVLGTALLIAGEPDGRGLGHVLACRPVRAVGRWSYGWYLWHWPFLVLGAELFTDSLATKVVLAAASLALAALTYRLIEQPVRHAPIGTTGSLALGAALLAAALIGVQLAQARTTSFFDDPGRARVLAASTDWFHFEPECTGTDAAVLLQHCVSGPAGTTTRVLLYGDSHLSHWRPAIEPAADALGVQTVRSVLGNCFGLADGLTTTDDRCQARASDVSRLIDDLRPSAVVIGHATVYRDIRIAGVEPADQLGAWRTAVRDLAIQLGRLDIPLVVLLDVPRYPVTPLECMVERSDWSSCALPTRSVEAANAAVNGAIRQGLVDAGHGEVFDPVPLLCPGDRCLLEYDGEILPQDSHHITTAAAARFEPVFRSLLHDLMARR